MPIPVTKYRCGFKCGIRAMNTKLDMEKHEQRCLKNPENKSCRTCKNEIYDSDTDEDGRKLHYRGCKLEVMNEFIDEMYKTLETDTVTRHVKPLVHCPNWNVDEVQDGTDEYLKEIRPKLQEAHRRALEASSLPF